MSSGTHLSGRPRLDVKSDRCNVVIDRLGEPVVLTFLTGRLRGSLRSGGNQGDARST